MRVVNESTDTSFLRVAEAGRALGVSESTIWRMLRRRTLPSVLRGGRRLIPREALERLEPRPPSEDVPALQPDHPIFRLVGAGRGGGRAPGAREKHAILDE